MNAKMIAIKNTPKLTDLASLAILLIATLYSGAAHSSAPAAPALSFEEAIKETSLSNAELQAARESLRSFESLTQGSFNGFLPTLSGNVGTSWNNATTYTSGFASTSKTNSSASATVNQNLFSGFQDQIRLTTAKKNEDLSRVALQLARSKVSYDLKTSYCGLYFSQKGLELTRAITLRREENLHLVELRFDSGRENKGSVLLSKAYLAQSALEHLQAQNNLKTTQTQLAKVLGRPDFDKLQATQLPQFLSPPPAGVDLRSLAAATPDHQQAILKEDLSQNTLSASYAAFYPSLGFSGSLGTQGSGYGFGTERWSAALTLSFPLFSGFKDYFTAKSSSALFLAASQNRLSVDQELLTRIQQALTNFTEAIEKKKVDDLFYEAALTRAQIAREKYNNGLLTFEDWDVIENDLIVREKARLQSAQNQFLTEAAWEQVLGKGVLP
ncbi:TolC family protein [Bdellovibrionota bacterium FG-2]